MSSILRWGMAPVALLYKVVVLTRHWLYDHHRLPVERLPVPVISVGNIQMGGTGKTPLIIHLIHYFQDRGKRVAVLTRGYRRKVKKNFVFLTSEYPGVDSQFIGDEPALIYQHLKDGALGVGANRREVARHLLSRFQPDIILLDDGLQHRAIHRDVDICLIDVTRWHHPRWLFPVSYFRDVPTVLQRVSAIILTKGEWHPEALHTVRQEIKQRTSAPQFVGNFQMVAIRNLKNGREMEWKRLAGQKCMVFCGIANPNHFVAGLKQNGLLIIKMMTFPDHHHYTASDVQRLVHIARELQVTHLITTEKDAVKLANLITSFPETVNVWSVVTEFHVEPADTWRAFLTNIIPSRKELRGTL